MDEPVAWVKRCPNPMPGPSEIEIRPLYEPSDWSRGITQSLCISFGRLLALATDVGIADIDG
jgi:hypothetical protein